MELVDWDDLNHKYNRDCDHVTENLQGQKKLAGNLVFNIMYYHRNYQRFTKQKKTDTWI